MHELRVIIGDNNSEELKQMKKMLVRAGMNIIGEARDSVSVLKMCRHFEPELLIMDVSLPGMDALEVAAILGREGDIPVILTSSEYRYDIVEKAKDAMVMAFMIKPLDEDTLLANIEIALANYHKLRDLTQEVRELKSSLESRKTVEIAKGILMRKLGITEEAAFKRIQKQSMEKRKPMKEIAESIIIAYEI